MARPAANPYVAGDPVRSDLNARDAVILNYAEEVAGAAQDAADAAAADALARLLPANIQYFAALGAARTLNMSVFQEQVLNGAITDATDLTVTLNAGAGGILTGMRFRLEVVQAATTPANVILYDGVSHTNDVTLPIPKTPGATFTVRGECHDGVKYDWTIDDADGPKYAEALASVSTSSVSFQSLTGGPSVKLGVPANSLVEIHAIVDITSDASHAGKVAIYDDVSATSTQILTVTSATVVTQRVAQSNSAGNATILGGWTVLYLPAGVHNLELRYTASSGFTTAPTFANRRLWARIVRPVGS